jgi:molecular chaperone DnaK
MLHQISKSLEDNKDDAVISEDEEKEIVDAAAALEELLKDENATKEQIEDSLKTLGEKAQKLMEAEMKKSQGGDAAQGAADTKKKKEDDDIIDADVE